MKSAIVPYLAFAFFFSSAFTCGRKKNVEVDLPTKTESASISPLSEEFKPSVQIDEPFEIHVGGCGDNPDLVSDFNHYTATNQRVVETYGLSVQIVKNSKRCGYTLHKGQHKLDMDWSDFDSFWKQFRTFYNLTD